MNIKQKIIKSHNGNEIKEEMDIALQMGWLVHSLTVNPETNTWIAILYRTVT
jgi:hypothetical protein